MNTNEQLTEEKFISLFKDSGSSSADNIVAEAKEYLNRAKFPGRKDETWKNTNIKNILQADFKPVKFKLEDYLGHKKLIDNQFTIPGIKSHTLVLVDGNYIPEISTIQADDADLVIESMQQAQQNHASLVSEHLGFSDSHKEHIFAALNCAYADKGLFVLLPKGKTAKYPVHIISLTDGKAGEHVIQTKNLVIVDENASLNMYYAFHSLSHGAVLTNNSIDLIINESARVNLYQLQAIDMQSFIINKINVLLKDNSVFNTCTSSLCGSVIRNEIQVQLKGEHAEATLNGIYLPDSGQILDNFVYVEHAKPNCVSNQHYRGVANDNGTGVFLGKIFVAQDAQKTTAYQSNKNILMTKKAKISSKPQLEIYADDVRCSHGSTTGQIDEDALFYLRARGIPEPKAKQLLIQAFTSNVLGDIHNEHYKNYIELLIEEKLSGKSVRHQCMGPLV